MRRAQGLARTAASVTVTSLVAVSTLVGCAGAEEDPAPSSGPETASPTGSAEGPVRGPASELALTQDDPTGEVPFPADLRPDTSDASGDARLSPTGVRFGVHESFDRVVVDLSGPGTPGWSAEYVEEPTAAGSGEPVSLAGAAAIELRVQGVVMPTEEGAEPWSGPDVLEPQTGGNVQEAERGPLFEGTQQLFVGLDSEEPFRVFALEDPTRVVLDVYHPEVSFEGPVPGPPDTSEPPFPADRSPDTREAGDGATLSPVDLRFGFHRQFDRVVLDVTGDGLPGWRAEYDDDPRLPGSGAAVDLAGDATLRVGVTGVVYPNREGAWDYRGPQRFAPEPSGVVEEVVYGSIYEGQVEVYVGLSSEQPFRVFLLEEPGEAEKHVVIDVTHP